MHHFDEDKGVEVGSVSLSGCDALILDLRGFTHFCQPNFMLNFMVDSC